MQATRGYTADLGPRRVHQVTNKWVAFKSPPAHDVCPPANMANQRFPADFDPQRGLSEVPIANIVLDAMLTLRSRIGAH